MGLRIVGQAAAMFTVTNIDDIVILSLFFGRAAGRHADSFRVVLGQYLGFAAILLAAVLGSLGAGLLPESVIPYLGLVPLLLGLRAAGRTWRESRGAAGHDDGGLSVTRGGTAVLTVAAVTLANGGDNIGVYVPVFATTDISGVVTYCLVFLVMVGVWCAAGHFFATRPLLARALSRWGHHLLPVVLIGLGLVILLEGGVLAG